MLELLLEEVARLQRLLLLTERCGLTFELDPHFAPLGRLLPANLNQYSESSYYGLGILVKFDPVWSTDCEKK